MLSFILLFDAGETLYLVFVETRTCNTPIARTMQHYFCPHTSFTCGIPRFLFLTLPPFAGPPQVVSLQDEHGLKRRLRSSALPRREVATTRHAQAPPTTTSETLPRRMLQKVIPRRARPGAHPSALQTRIREALPQRLQVVDIRGAPSNLHPQTC